MSEIIDLLMESRYQRKGEHSIKERVHEIKAIQHDIKHLSSLNEKTQETRKLRDELGDKYDNLWDELIKDIKETLPIILAGELLKETEK